MRGREADQLGGYGSSLCENSRNFLIRKYHYMKWLVLAEPLLMSSDHSPLWIPQGGLIHCQSLLEEKVRFQFAVLLMMTGLGPNE